MNSVNTEHLDNIKEALQSFLTMLIGDEAPLQVDPPVTTTFSEAQAQTPAYIVVLAKPTPSNPGFAVMLDGNCLSVFSRAMLGEEIGINDEGAEDLLRELAAQGYGAVRNQMAATGTKLPDRPFEILKPGNPISPGLLPDQLIEINFGIKTSDKVLGGFVLWPSAVEQPRREQPASQPTAASKWAAAPHQPVPVAPVTFPDLGHESAGGDGVGGNFGLLAEVELEVTVELGRRKLPLADMLRLTTGSVIELEKLVGEPLEVYANGRLIAEGEAVVIDEQFGIRITSLATNRQRTKAFL